MSPLQSCPWPKWALSQCKYSGYKYWSCTSFSWGLSGKEAVCSSSSSSSIVTTTRREEQTCKQLLIGWLNNHLIFPLATLWRLSVILRQCLTLPRSWENDSLAACLSALIAMIKNKCCCMHCLCSSALPLLQKGLFAFPPKRQTHFCHDGLVNT